MSSDIRFGVGIWGSASQSEFQQTARCFENLGFDVFNVADHLGGPAPFPMLAAAAQVTSRIRLGTYVLNAAFYRPALLARDAAAVDLLSDGRLDLGLGTGYVRAEFEAAELPFPSAGARVAHLEHVTKHLKANHPAMPVMVAGNGDRVLTVAARYADTIGLTGADLGRDVDDPLAERVAFVREAAGERFGSIELDLAITACPSDDSGRPDLSIARRYSPHLSDEQLIKLPGTLAGTARDVADKIRLLNATYGVNSLTVQQRHAAFISSVIAELR